jgi:hypothetical protein
MTQFTLKQSSTVNAKITKNLLHDTLYPDVALHKHCIQFVVEFVIPVYPRSSHSVDCSIQNIFVYNSVYQPVVRDNGTDLN